MAEIQVLFTAQAPSGVQFSELDENTFFEYQGCLYLKIDDETVVKITNDGLEAVEVDSGWGDGLESDSLVIRSPAGVGFTLMQAA